MKFFKNYHFYRKNLVIKMHLKLICPKIYIGGVFWQEGPKMEKRGVLLKKFEKHCYRQLLEFFKKFFLVFHASVL